MEDNFTDKQSIDQAWSMMRSTLDKEMPVKKKKKFIWWIPLFLGAALLGGWYFTAHTPDGNLPVKKSTAEKSIDKVIANTASENNLNTKKTIEEPKQINNEEKNTRIDKTTSPIVDQKSRSNNNIKAQTETTNSKTIALQNQNNQNDNARSQLNPKNTSQTIKNLTIDIVDTEKKNLEIAKINQNKNQITKPITNEKEEKNSVEKPRSREALTIANSLPSLSLARFDIEENSLPSQAINLPQNKKLNFAFKTAVLTDLRFRTPTHLTEMQVVKKLSSRWSVLSGLGVKSQFILRNSDNFRFRAAAQTNREGDFDPINNAFEDSTIGGDLAFDRDSKNGYFFSFLYVPVTAVFNVKNSWNFEGGLHYNFLSLVGTYQLPGFSPSGVEGFKNHNHFAFHFSTNYQLNKKTSISFQYQTNTQRFSKGARIHDRHQIGVGFKHRF